MFMMRVILAAIFQQNPSLKSLVIFLPPCISSWILADVKVAISPLKVYSSSLQLGVGFLQNLCFVRFLKMLKIELELFAHSNIYVAKICVQSFLVATHSKYHSRVSVSILKLIGTLAIVLAKFLKRSSRSSRSVGRKEKRDLWNLVN